MTHDINTRYRNIEFRNMEYRNIEFLNIEYCDIEYRNTEYRNMEHHMECRNMYTWLFSGLQDSQDTHADHGVATVVANSLISNIIE